MIKSYSVIEELLYRPIEYVAKKIELVIKYFECVDSVSSKDYDERSTTESEAWSENKSKDELILNYLSSLNFFKNKDIHVLDLMAGTGRMSYHLSKSFPSSQITAIDYSSSSLEIAKKRLGSHNIETVTASVLQMPFSANKFDLIICGDGMEHLYDYDHLTALREVYRCVKKNGIFIFYTPNLCRLLMEYFIQKFKYFLKGKHYGYQKGLDSEDHQDTRLHIGLSTTIRYIRLMKIAGFSKVGEVVFNDEYNIPLISKAFNLVGFLNPFFMKNITIIGYKEIH